MAREYDRKNPVFARPQTGVKANHSSAERSVASAENAQSDDELQNVPPPQDPNISGTAPTRDCYTWLAGKLDGWKENDDYREYFEQSIGSNGMLDCDPCDGDYDDNGGYPTALGHGRGVHGMSRDGGLGGEYQADSYPLGPVIIRRL
jgi:hypothetical protein